MAGHVHAKACGMAHTVGVLGVLAVCTVGALDVLATLTVGARGVPAACAMGVVLGVG